jgi:hypothetical protein
MKTLTFSILLMSASVGFANEAMDERMNHAPIQSQLTRGQVVDEYLQARADGTLPDTSEGVWMPTPYASGATLVRRLTREQVTAEYLQARSEGSLVDTSEAGSMHTPVFAGARPVRPEIFAEGVAVRGDVSE